MLSLALALAALPAATTLDTDDLPVEWRGKSIPVSALADALAADEVCTPEFAGKLTAQLERYADWATETEYHVALSDNAIAVLFTESAKIGKRRMKLVEKTLDSFAEVVPTPERDAKSVTYPKFDWGTGPTPPDTEPVLLFEVRKDRDYRSLVVAAEKTGVLDPSWGRVMSENPGFIDPLIWAAGWQESPNGFEVGDVWRTEHELVNRLSRLLLHRSFGMQPVWFRVATAWIIEQEVLKGIYSFPYRHEFVGVGEHKGWKNELRQLFKRRKGEALGADEFATWKRGTWDDDTAAVAWGLATLLHRTEPGRLGALAEAFRLGYKDATIKGRNYTPIEQLAPAAQEEILTRVAGPEVLTEACEFFRTAKLPKKKRSR